MNKHAHIHTCKQTHTHTHTHTHIKHTHTPTYTNTHTHTHTHTHTAIHTSHFQTCTQWHMHTHAHNSPQSTRAATSGQSWHRSLAPQNTHCHCMTAHRADTFCTRVTRGARPQSASWWSCQQCSATARPHQCHCDAGTRWSSGLNACCLSPCQHCARRTHCVCWPSSWSGACTGGSENKWNLSGADTSGSENGELWKQMVSQISSSSYKGWLTQTEWIHD